MSWYSDHTAVAMPGKAVPGKALPFTCDFRDYLKEKNVFKRALNKTEIKLCKDNAGREQCNNRFVQVMLITVLI